MYKATKQWQPNQYMRLLVKHGIIYFFTYVNRFIYLSPPAPRHLCCAFEYMCGTLDSSNFALTRSLLYNTTETILSGTGFTISSSSMTFLICFVYFLFAAIMPRFIISVRELYDRDLRAPEQGIDSGFGVPSQPIRVLSAIAFADVAPGQESDTGYSEAIRLELVGDGARQV
jgi:hypothetical protein